MALDLVTKYAGNINPGDANYPYGSARNIATPGDGTGTPLDESWMNDLFGLLQILLTKASIVPSGSPDTILASQYFDALLTITNRINNAGTSLNSLTGANEELVKNHIDIDSGGNAVSWTSPIVGATLESLQILFAQVRNTTGAAIKLVGPIDGCSINNGYFKNIVTAAINIGTSDFSIQDDWNSFNITANKLKNITALAANAVYGMLVHGLNHGIIGNSIDGITGASTKKVWGIYSKMHHSVIAMNRICNLVGVDSGLVTGIDINGSLKSESSGSQGYAGACIGNVFKMDDDGIAINVETENWTVIGNIVDEVGLSGVEYDSKVLNQISTIANNIVSQAKIPLSVGVKDNAGGQGDIISNNVIENLITGVHVGNTLAKESLSITGNVITNCDKGIDFLGIAALTNLNISGNLITDSITNPIEFDGIPAENVVIDNNTIDNSNGLYPINWSAGAAPNKLSYRQTNYIINTTDDTPIALFILPLNESSAFHVKVKITAIQSGGINRAYFDKEMFVYRQGSGSATLQGPVIINQEIRSNPAWTVVLETDTNNMICGLTGVAATNITWKCSVEFESVN